MKVSANYKWQKLKFFKEFFKGQACLFALVINLLFSVNLFAQKLELKGSILNGSGQPIPAATIIINGSGGKTLSNAKGLFIIGNVDSSAVLSVSCIGYESNEYRVNGKTSSLKIVLKPNLKQLEDVEVVSSGYQVITKERATGSFVKIDNAALNQQVGTNILQRLDGVSNGLLFNVGKQNSNPQNKTNITIRGLSTINGPLDPLIVLDGFIYEGDINNINPNDVDNITILKDATAASIWGARAGNGVIVITTKKGKLNQKLQVSLNVNTIISTKPDLFYLPQISSGDYINVEEFLFNKGYFNNRINNPYESLTPAVQVFLDKQNGFITAGDSASHINSLKAIDSRDQYNKYVYRNALTQQYFVNLQGGNNTNAYTFSLGYDKSKGELSDQTKKINIRLENIFQPLKNLQINVGVYYTNSTNLSGKQGYSASVAGRQVPYLRLADESGSPLSLAVDYRDTYTDTAGEGKLLNWKYYPLEDYKHNISKTNLQELYANAGLQYKINSALSFDLKYQYQQQSSANEQVNDIESYAARNMINQFTQYNRQTNVIQYIVPLGGIKTTGNSKVESYTARAQVNYIHSRGDHDLSAIVGGEVRQAISVSNGNILYGYNADPLISTIADYVNYYPTFVTGEYSQVQGGTAFSNSINRFVSLYANGAYTLRKRYSVSASVRRDGSNIFGLNTNDKWKPLWSVGTSWKLSDEAFYHSALLPVLKLRATYGYSGNVDLSRSAVSIGNYYASSSINLPFVRINVINNPNLRWEKIGIFNLGIDFGFKKNVVTGSLEYYHKYGVDLYGTTPFDYTTWGANNVVTSNVANMQGQGIDLILNSKNIDRSFKWITTLLFNYNTSKTTKYNNESATQIGALISNGGSITPFIGKPLYAIAAYKWGGLNSEGNPQGYVNGKLSTDYRAIVEEGVSRGLNGNVMFIGSSSPIVFGSFINTISFKNFTASLNIRYKFGYYFKRPYFTSGSLIQGGVNKDYEKRWQQPGDENTTNVPSFVYPADSDRDGFYGSSEVNVLKADHIRLQYINIAWALTKVKKKVLPFMNIQFYANASNLGILWRANKEKIDPDYPGSVPPLKSFAIGIRANF